MAVMRRLMLCALMLGALGSCMDDTVDVPTPEPGRPYCMIAGPTLGHLPDSRIEVVRWQTRSPAGCACLQPSDRADDGPNPWSEETLAKLNDLALEDCEKAARQWDFLWDECQEHYESGAWLEIVWYAGEDGEHVNYLPPDLYCTDDLTSSRW